MLVVQSYRAFNCGVVCTTVWVGLCIQRKGCATGTMCGMVDVHYKACEYIALASLDILEMMHTPSPLSCKDIFDPCMKHVLIDMPYEMKSCMFQVLCFQVWYCEDEHYTCTKNTQTHTHTHTHAQTHTHTNTHVHMCTYTHIHTHIHTHTHIYT